MRYTTITSPYLRSLRDDYPQIPTVHSGMTKFIRGLVPRCRAVNTLALLDLKWDAETAEFKAYLDQLLAAAPLPDSAKCLWVETPDAIYNHPTTQLCAFDILDPAAPAFGLDDSELNYPSDRALMRVGVFAFDTLSAAVRRLEIDSDTDPESPKVALAMAVCHIYTALVTLRVLAALRGKLIASRKDLPVLFGPHDGDSDVLGSLTHVGWRDARFSRSRPTRGSSLRRRAADPRKLDYNDLGFDVEAYLAAEGDPDAVTREGEPLLLRVVFEREMMALVRAGADVNAAAKDGRLPITSLNAQNKRLLLQLLDAGANANARENGVPVLFNHLASGLARTDKIRLLIDRGADPRARDREGNTAMHALARQSLFEPRRRSELRAMLGLLRSTGVRINSRNHSGVSPLWVPITAFARGRDWRRKRPERYQNLSDAQIVGDEYGYDRVAIELLRAGADPNSRTREKLHPLIPAGATPLMVRRYGRGSMHLALLVHGANPRLRSPEGRTAIDYAQMSLRAAERAWSRRDQFAKGSAERRTELLRHPEDPRVIRRVLSAMEACAHTM